VTFAVVERTSSIYDFTLLDENQDPVPLSVLSSLTLTLYDRQTNTIINSRDAVSVLNVNGGTYANTSGAGTFKFAPADHVIVGTGSVETHIALFDAIWDGPGQTHWEVVIQVSNLNRLPA
jgi:hypothetical protein